MANTGLNLIGQRGGEGREGPLGPVLPGLCDPGVEVQSALAVQRRVPLLAGGQVLVVNIARPLGEIFNIAGRNWGNSLLSGVL